MIKVPLVHQASVWNRHLDSTSIDYLATEYPIALIYNGIAHIVIMSLPKDIENLALGFSLSEGIITKPSDIYDIRIINHHNGIEVNINISTRKFMLLKQKRRTMLGITSCGLCGLEKLENIYHNIKPLPFTQNFKLKKLNYALSQLKKFQPIGQLSSCTHVAAWMNSDGLLLAGFEDIGRHSALDKLLGYNSKQVKNDFKKGAVLISSRASFEMVQKSIICSIEILFAISAATHMAVQIADKNNLTLVGFNRLGSSTIYTHPKRLL